jgi:hypothetical protein
MRRIHLSLLMLIAQSFQWSLNSKPHCKVLESVKIKGFTASFKAFQNELG